MKKSLLILSACAGLIAMSCSNVNSSNGGGDKPLTENIPSIDKTVREGRQLGRSAVSVQTAAATGSGTTGELGSEINVNTDDTGANREYTLLDRLYNTTWYQSEKDSDDGKIEVEEKFILFNSNSEISKREYENGRLDETDYATLEYLKSFRTPLIEENTDANACIVRNTERHERDMEYEGYYLVDKDTLYIVDGDTDKEVIKSLKDLINGNTDPYIEDKYVLSTRRG